MEEGVKGGGDVGVGMGIVDWVVGGDVGGGNDRGDGGGGFGGRE